jgi:hypothetical protein
MDKAKIYQILVAVIMLIAMVYGRNISFPDNVHVLHGLPLVWSTHQLVTIAGPVDTWRVNMVNMIVDLVFWAGLIILIPYLSSNLSKN